MLYNIYFGTSQETDGITVASQSRHLYIVVKLLVSFYSSLITSQVEPKITNLYTYNQLLLQNENVSGYGYRLQNIS